MKKLLSVLLIVSILSLAIPFHVKQVHAADILTNLQGYWTMDESSTGVGAVSRLDSTANNNDLTDVNTTASATGIIGNGADFERANSEYLTITDAAQTGLDITGDIAVSFWYKPEVGPTTGVTYEAITKWNGVDGNGAYRFMYYNDAGVLKQSSMMYDSVAPTTNIPFSARKTLADGSWYHIVFSFDITTEAMTIYVNGSSVGLAFSPFGAAINNNAANFSIGDLEIGVQGFVDGIIDEVGIWSRELTSLEVLALYNNGAGLAYPLSYTTCTTNCVETFATTTTWTVPANVSSAKIACWGGGGGGDVIAASAGGGGGGGAFASSTVALTAGNNYTVTIGNAGRGGDTPTTGGDSTFVGNDKTVNADGGTQAIDTANGTGGTVAGSTGDVENDGGNGGDGLTTDDAGGGGGGSGGPDGDGAIGADASATVGGGGGGANGGGAGGQPTAGTAGSNAGAGGTGDSNGATSPGGFPGEGDINGGGGGGGGDNGDPGGNGGFPGGGGGGGEIVGSDLDGGNGQGGMCTITYTAIAPVPPSIPTTIINGQTILRGQMIIR